MEAFFETLTPHKQTYRPIRKSVYEYLYAEAKNYGNNDVALSFYGKHIGYQTLLEKIEKVARALSAYGVKAGDHVLVSLPAIPEAVYLLYAINKIGAKYCAFDCRSKKEDVWETIGQFSPKICFICDFHMREFKNISNIPIVCIAPAYSVSGRLSEISVFFRRCFTVRQKNMVYYHRFIKGNVPKKTVSNGRGRTSDPDIFGYFYTSGTTYGRKSVILTNENINASVEMIAMVEHEVCRGDRLLNIMPLFACYGVTMGTHLPLVMGVAVHLIPLINIKKLKKTILQEKPNHIISVPAHWEYFANETFKGVDLSFLKTVTVGGDRVDPVYEKNINHIFRFCGSGACLRKGYGLTETASCATYPATQKSTVGNSVGRAHIYMRIAIFDVDSGKELPIGEIGEICVLGPTLCKGYYKDREATERLLRLHEDGLVWLHSGDRGYLDKDGNLFFCERIKRMYVRFDGTKISPYSIEKALEKCPLIKQVLILAERDTAHSHGMCAKALIVLSENVEGNKARALKLIEKYIRENLGEHMQPRYVEIVERLPHTKNGKLDYFNKTL